MTSKEESIAWGYKSNKKCDAIVVVSQQHPLTTYCTKWLFFFGPYSKFILKEKHFCMCIYIIRGLISSGFLLRTNIYFGIILRIQIKMTHTKGVKNTNFILIV